MSEEVETTDVAAKPAAVDGIADRVLQFQQEVLSSEEETEPPEPDQGAKETEATPEPAAAPVSEDPMLQFLKGAGVETKEQLVQLLSAAVEPREQEPSKEPTNDHVVEWYQEALRAQSEGREPRLAPEELREAERYARNLSNRANELLSNPGAFLSQLPEIRQLSDKISQLEETLELQKHTARLSQRYQDILADPEAKRDFLDALAKRIPEDTAADYAKTKARLRRLEADATQERDREAAQKKARKAPRAAPVPSYKDQIHEREKGSLRYRIYSGLAQME